MQKGDARTTTITTIIRGDLNQPASSGYQHGYRLQNIVIILICVYIKKKRNIDLRQSKRGSPLGLPK